MDQTIYIFQFLYLYSLHCHTFYYIIFTYLVYIPLIFDIIIWHRYYIMFISMFLVIPLLLFPLIISDTSFLFLFLYQSLFSLYVLLCFWSKRNITLFASFFTSYSTLPLFLNLLYYFYKNGKLIPYTFSIFPYSKFPEILSSIPYIPFVILL